MATCTGVYIWADAHGASSLSQLQEKIVSELRGIQKSRWSIDVKLYKSSRDLSASKDEDFAKMNNEGVFPKMQSMYVLSWEDTASLILNSAVGEKEKTKKRNKMDHSFVGNKTDHIVENKEINLVMINKKDFASMEQGEELSELIEKHAEVKELVDARKFAKYPAKQQWVVTLEPEIDEKKNGIDGSIYSSHIAPSSKDVIKGVYLADPEMDNIFSKLKNLWKLRQSAKVEGYTFDLVDFVISIGNMMVGTAYKGLIVQIEYLPCDDFTKTESLLDEMARMVFPERGVFRKGKLYSSEKNREGGQVATQYVNLFTENNLI
ncbi:hypothetical protein BB559_000461 [Furculomyces boomerangus]|uniref:Mediator of RNA polymerase II transcription subunit 20 n=2 Tax=Harpellales TaxID=61421 RepID=A0A2T9Z589_9FUNG|nr:hypothetical protein BB559_000461 [Furculomyces boomerangus]PWA02649.1 hypothetical protein BB558_001197 [Smittium angustum]